MLSTHEECLLFLEKIRWDEKPRCPYCESTHTAALRKERRYHCNTCFTSFSVTVGTLFHQTHVDLHKWFQAIQLVLNQSRRISVRQLANEIGVSKNTASYMIDRIRKAINDEPELLHKIMNALD